MGVSINNSGAQKKLSDLRAMDRRASNPSAVWPKVGSYWRMAISRQFATKGAYFGQPWQPLKPGYALWKVSHGYSRNLLVQTGAMRASFISSPMSIEKYMGNTAVFGSTNQKAVWQHFGTHRNGKRAIPPRKIMVKTAKNTKDIQDIMAEYVLGRQSGGVRARI